MEKYSESEFLIGISGSGFCSGCCFVGGGGGVSSIGSKKSSKGGLSAGLFTGSTGTLGILSAILLLLLLLMVSVISMIGGLITVTCFGDTDLKNKF